MKPVQNFTGKRIDRLPANLKAFAMLWIKKYKR